ncbi:unnamed protein product [Tilletia controversa]|nr:unnamed protein product [Tilletia controversa]
MVVIGAYSVGPIGLGLMALTWCDPESRTPDEQAFEVIKTAIEASGGERTLLNSGSFYGPSVDPYANLKLLRRFFTKYPELKDKVVLYVKGGVIISEYMAKGMAGYRNSCAFEDLRTDVVDIRKQLGSDEGGIELHVYEPSRRDTKFSMEEIVTSLHTLQKEGLFKHIALSEIGADSINTAISTAKKLGTAIVSVELEYSPFETELETNGVLDAVKAQGVPILAYSPVGKGFLTGQMRSRADIPKGDIRLSLDRFSEENFPKNLELADTFAKLAAEHKPTCTPAQLALAWLIKQGAGKTNIIPIPGTSKPERVKENMAAKDIAVSDEDNEKLRKILASMNVHGERYNARTRSAGNLFG